MPDPDFPAAWVDIVARSLHAVICRQVDCRDLPSCHGPAREALAALQVVDALVTPPGMRAVDGPTEQAIAVGIAVAQALPRGVVTRDEHGDLRFDAEALTSVLTDAGLLLPAGGKVTVEWGVQHFGGEPFAVAGPRPKLWTPGVVAVRREVRAWPDGSQWTGPWTPADSDEVPGG